jgi:hypothetical protein
MYKRNILLMLGEFQSRVGTSSLMRTGGCLGTHPSKGHFQGSPILDKDTPPDEDRGCLVLVCNWPHSIGQNHFIVMMLFNRDSAIQKCFQKILHSLQVRKFGSLPAVETTCHTIQMPSCP